MPKPWAKLEQNFINHQKFLALNSNAICLWLEGKNYCDIYMTDGMIPKTALKTFRFEGPKAIELLTTSCGRKPNGEAFAPLWEAVDVGGVGYYRMHDYLLHNDCRDEVLVRLEDAEDAAAIRRAANKERQAKYRAERKAKLVAVTQSVTVTSALRNGDITRTCSTPTETATETTTKERTIESALFDSAFEEDAAEATFDAAIATFLQRYQAIYAEERHGSHYHIRGDKDVRACEQLLDGWKPERLEDMARVFLHLDGKQSLNKQGTLGQFLYHASQCDMLLRQHGR